MVVDRGGLRYTINVVDEFTANTQKFRDEIRKSREEFIKFRRSSRLLNTQITKDQKSAQRALVQARKNAKSESRERLTQVNAGIAQQKELEKIRAAANKDQRAEDKLQRKARSESVAAREAANQKSAKASRLAARRGVILRESLVKQESAANKLLFTFRRLVGVLALFTIARQVSAGFGALVKSGFAFNQTIERSRLGIAGIITAVGQVKNEQGEVVKGAEAFVVATTAARAQQKALQRDALLTTATFEELLNVFQIATGPGLAAGLNLDQIRKISILVSQAASAIDLPQNQLSEEIRALLTGNIRTTTTRIAQVLNLTPADVKGAIRQGELFELLTNRLEGFSLAAEKTAQTVGGLAARIKGALQVIAGEANVKGFESLRIVLDQIFNSLLLVKRDAKGVIQSFKLNPDAVKPFTAIFDAIDGVIRLSATLARNVGFADLTATAEAFAVILGGIGQGIAAIIAGTVSGFADVKNILSVILAPFAALAELIEDVFGEGTILIFLAAMVEAAVAVTGLKLAFGLLVGIVPKLVKTFVGIDKSIQNARIGMILLREKTKLWVVESKIGAATWKVISSRITLALGAIGLLALGATKFLSSILAVEISLGDLPGVLGGIFENFFTKFIALGGFFTTFVAKKTLQAFNSVVSGIKIAALKLKRFFEFDINASKDLVTIKDIELAQKIAEIEGDAATKSEAIQADIERARNVANRQIDDANSLQGKKLDLLREEKRLQELLARGEEPVGGDILPPLKQDTDADRQAAIIDLRRLEIQRTRVETASRIAKIEASSLSTNEKELRISKQLGNQFQRERGAREEALFAQQALAIIAVRDSERTGDSTEERQLALKQKLKNINDAINAIELERNNIDAEQLEIERRLGIEGRGFLAIGREKIVQAQRLSDRAVFLLETDKERAELALQDATSEEEKAAILERIKQLNIDITTQKLLQNQAAERANFELKFAAAQARGEALEGLEFGFLSFAEQFKNSFDAAVDIAQSSIARLATFISTVISDAFDPNKDQSIKERLGNFLKDISKIIIDALTKLAIAKLILGFSSPAGGTDLGGGPSLVGTIQGGRIPGRAQASVAHYANPQGLAGGGRARPPKGIDRRDTTPIWAQPGEFMMRLSAVRKYGMGVMNAINSGIIDPTALASMSGARRLSNNTRRTVGFATGGEIQRSGQDIQAASAASGGGDGGGGIGIGLLVANEQTAERFLAGGKKAFLDFIDENGADIDGRLARFRS